MFLLYFISTIVGYLIGNLTSLKSLIYLLQFVLIYILTISYVDSKKWSKMLLIAWTLTIFLSSILVINSYFNGIELINFGDDFYEQVNKNDINYFFRASFYYGGYIFSVGIVLLCLFVRQLYLTKLSDKITGLLISLVCLIALLLTFNKTVFVSLLAALSIIIFKYYNFSTKKIKRKFFYFFISLFIILTTFIISITNKIDNNQILYLFASVENLSSLNARFIVYKTALINFFDYPLGWVFGMGPDFLENVNSIDFRMSNRGYYEGTVDSGYISYLIELGFINFILLLYLLFKSLKVSYRASIDGLINYDSKNNISLYMYISMIFLCVALSTQMLGYTKTAWFPFQIILIGYIHNINLKKS